MEQVFKALADHRRRGLLDRLFANDGQTVSELCQATAISRQAISKHLKVLEQAGLIVSHWQGREKLHYLNPVPLQELSERWISKYLRRRAAAISAPRQPLPEHNDDKT